MAGFFNRRPEPERKLMAEIESTEFKKQSIIAPLQNEIRMAQQRIDQLLHHIGYEVYNGHINGATEQVDLKAHYDAIGDQKMFIKEKEAKIAEFVGRYDEELSMLKANLNQMMMSYAPQPMPGAMHVQHPPIMEGGASKAFCGECGTQYTVGQDAFCGGCGNKL